jgi:predicted aspartyl protease
LAGGTPGTEELYKSLANFSQILNTGAESVRKVLDTIASKLDESFNGSQNITQTNNGVSNNSNPAAIVDALGNRLDRFIEQLQNALPPFIRVEGQHQVNVVINGGAILQQLLSGPIGNIVQNAIQSAFDKQSRKREGF